MNEQRAPAGRATVGRPPLRRPIGRSPDRRNKDRARCALPIGRPVIDAELANLSRLSVVATHVAAALVVALVVRGLRDKSAATDGARVGSAFARSFAALGLIGVVSLLSGLVITGSPWGAMNTVAHGLFIDCPLALLLGAVLDRRSGLPRLALAQGAAAALLVAVGVDAFLIEPHSLEINSHTVPVRGLKAPLRIAVLADLQAEEIGEREKHVLDVIRDAEPDLVLLPGDLVQQGYGPPLKQLRRDLHAAIAASWGTADAPRLARPALVVGGDVDLQGWPAALRGVAAEPVATVRGQQHRSLDDLGIDVTGLNLRNSRDRSVVIRRPRDRPHIVFGHAPDFALGEVDADVLVAGHTHGGQVQLPFIGPLITLSAVPRDWAHGLTSLDEDRTLLVSRGVGVERYLAPRLRFLCRPEVVLLNLVPADLPPTARDAPRPAG